MAPPHIDLRDLRAAILSIDGVVDVHDLHVWTVTSGLEAASGHIVVSPEHDYHGVLDEVLIVLRDEYSIDHPTIQCEPMAFEEPPRAV